MSSRPAKRARRPFYRRERAPDRLPGELGSHPPLGVPNATPWEIIAGCINFARQMGFTIGRGDGYDRVTDTFYVVGKSARTGKAQNFKIPGHEVALQILLLRRLTGREVCDPHGATARAQRPAVVAGSAGLEPATTDLTGQRSAI